MVKLDNQLIRLEVLLQTVILVNAGATRTGTRVSEKVVTCIFATCNYEKVISNMLN